MNLDEQIRKTLRENSQWPGSPDALWEKVSTELQKPKRARVPVWLGSAAAAIVALAFLLHTVWNPVPPPVPEVGEPIQMKAFLAVPDSLDPKTVQVGEEFELLVDVSPAASMEQISPLLQIWKQNEEGDLLADKRGLRGEELRSGMLMVEAPGEPGSYRLVVRGTFEDHGQWYSASAEQILVVAGSTEQP